MLALLYCWVTPDRTFLLQFRRQQHHYVNTRSTKLAVFSDWYWQLVFADSRSRRQSMLMHDPSRPNVLLTLMEVCSSLMPCGVWSMTWWRDHETSWKMAYFCIPLWDVWCDESAFHAKLNCSTIFLYLFFSYHSWNGNWKQECDL